MGGYSGELEHETHHSCEIEVFLDLMIKEEIASGKNGGFEQRSQQTMSDAENEEDRER